MRWRQTKGTLEAELEFKEPKTKGMQKENVSTLLFASSSPRTQL
jgi:hypothetical protein